MKWQILRQAHRWVQETCSCWKIQSRYINGHPLLMGESLLLSSGDAHKLSVVLKAQLG